MEGYQYDGKTYTYIGPWRAGVPNGKGRLIAPKSLSGVHTEIHETFEDGNLIRSCRREANYQKFTYETTSKVTKKTISFVDLESISAYVFGLYSIDSQVNSITLTFISAKAHPELRAAEVEETKFFHALPDDGTQAVTLLTGGLGFLLAPKKTSTLVFGCREEWQRTYRPDTYSTPTGLYKWLRDHRAKVSLRVTLQSQQAPEAEAITFDQIVDLVEKEDLEYTSVLRIPNEIVSALDASSVYLAKISCLRCNSDDADSKNYAKSLPTSRPLFTEIFEPLDLRSETQRLLNEKLMAEEEARRKALAGDGTPDDLSCKAKKLTPTTPPYIRCREQLVREATLRAEREAAAKAKKEAEDKKRREDAERREAAARAKKEAEDRRRREEAEREARDPFAAAKRQCKELGFKPGTESHGSCVLQLTR